MYADHPLRCIGSSCTSEAFGEFSVLIQIGESARYGLLVDKQSPFGHAFLVGLRQISQIRVMGKICAFEWGEKLQLINYFSPIDDIDAGGKGGGAVHLPTVNGVDMLVGVFLPLCLIDAGTLT